MRDVLTPSLLQTALAILEWAEEFLCKPNPEVGRPVGSQVVCPYLRSSLDHDAFAMVFHPEVAGDSSSEIEDLLVSYIAEFEALPPLDPGLRSRKALLVVFPNLAPDRCDTLDAVHARVKDRFVTQGLMLGQFHPQCEEPGGHNPSFRPSRSPVPLVAIRSMSPHDLLFLHPSQVWTEAHHERFPRLAAGWDAANRQPALPT